VERVSVIYKEDKEDEEDKATPQKRKRARK